MMEKIAILIGIISVVTACYTSALIGWVILGVAATSLLVTYFIFRIRRWKNIPELSPEANKRLRKYGHLYNIPSEDDDISDTTDIIAWAGVILAVIGCFKAFWWGIAVGVANYAIMEYLSGSFSWSKHILEYRDLTAHEEILNYLERKREEEQEKRDAAAREHQKAA
ncbi:MAG: hypothetical protein HZC17_03230 [Candidatus Omnitrophica bacterium]|nr:hypothetical protein [Candidatus Omnitrophota bacterium]